jgi:hypothetical protein
MRLNCKQGDFAVIVRSVARNEGKIVRCLHLHNSETHDADGKYLYDRVGGPRWVIEGDVRSREGYRLFTLADAALRPLRDSDGEDEVLRLVGKPHDERQAA